MEEQGNLRDFYIENGWCSLKNLFPSDTMLSIKKQIHEIFELQMKRAGISIVRESSSFISAGTFFSFFKTHSAEYISCMKTIQNLPSIYSLASCDCIISVLGELGLKFPLLAGKPIILMNSQFTSNSPAYWKVPPHQDWRSIQGSLNGVVVWIAIDFLPKERGRLEGISGSHKFGLLNTEKDEWYKHVEDLRIKEEDFEPVPVEIPGDAVIQSAFHVHRSGINTSNDFRYSLVFRFNDAKDEYFIDHNYPSTYGADSPVVDFVSEENTPQWAEIQKALNK